MPAHAVLSRSLRETKGELDIVYERLKAWRKGWNAPATSLLQECAYCGKRLHRGFFRDEMTTRQRHKPCIIAP